MWGTRPGGLYEATFKVPGRALSSAGLTVSALPNPLHILTGLEEEKLVLSVLPSRSRLPTQWESRSFIHLQDGQSPSCAEAGYVPNAAINQGDHATDVWHNHPNQPNWGALQGLHDPYWQRGLPQCRINSSIPVERKRESVI